MTSDIAFPLDAFDVFQYNGEKAKEELIICLREVKSLLSMSDGIEGAELSLLFHQGGSPLFFQLQYSQHIIVNLILATQQQPQQEQHEEEEGLPGGRDERKEAMERVVHHEEEEDDVVSRIPMTSSFDRQSASSSFPLMNNAGNLSASINNHDKSFDLGRKEKKRKKLFIDDDDDDEDD